MTWTERINPQVHTMWSGSWSNGMVEPPRILVDHELVLVARGCCQVVIAGVEHVLSARDFVIVPPGTVHHSRVLSGPCVRHCLHFDWAWSSEPAPSQLYGFISGRQPGERPRPAPAWVPSGILSGSAPPNAVGIAQRLQSYHGADNETLVRSTAFELLLTLFCEPAPAKTANRTTTLARQVKARLNHGDLDALSIRAALRELGHSYEYLCRTFTATYGIPPLKYVVLARIERAKALLSAPGASVAGVARSLGYDDPGYFARVFRSVTGCSPGRWPEAGGHTRPPSE